MKIPDDVRSEVIKEIFSRAALEKWEDLNSPGRTNLYNAWVSDPNIGRKLAPFLVDHEIRLWIKDGPMKEYGRARRGLGPYAKYIKTSVDVERQIALGVFGPGWTIVPGSISVKPAQFSVIDDEESRIDVLWGNFSDLKHLIWAWLNRRDGGESKIVVLSSRTQPIPRDTYSYIDFLASKINADIQILDR